MTLVLNLLYFVLGGGFVAGIAWVLLGCLLAITVVGIPFAVAAFRIAAFAAWPFGRTLVDARSVGEQPIVGTDIANILRSIQTFHAGPNGPLSGKLTDTQKTFLTSQIQLLKDASTGVVNKIAQTGSMANQIESLITSQEFNDC